MTFGKKRMAYNLNIHWRGELVGELRNAIPDMLYLEGTWIPLSSVVSDSFQTLVESFDIRSVFDDHTKGTRVILFERDSKSDPGNHAVVISLREGRLLLRRYMDDTAVEWLMNHVP